MDIVKIAEAIYGKINELETLKKELGAMPDQVANSSAEYEKDLAKTIIQLKNGIAFELDGVEIVNPLTTIVEKIARGICWKKALESQKTELMYKNLNKKIDIVEAQLNGYQSVLRNLSEL